MKIERLKMKEMDDIRDAEDAVRELDGKTLMGERYAATRVLSLTDRWSSLEWAVDLSMQSIK